MQIAVSAACCRKRELLQIVDHLKVQIPKTLHKSGLKALVIDKLVETGPMQVPHLPEMPVVPGEISRTSLCEGDHKNGSGIDGVGDDRGKMPRTLSRYDPLFSGSSEARDGVWLKVRPARLHLEAVEKTQVRRTQRELEICRL